MLRTVIVATLVLCMAQALCPASEQPFLVIGHRGACGYRPEHTIASYELAIEQGADFVEPDLVSTKDGVLICRHECEIGETTDAAEKFPERRRKAVIDGVEYDGWFAEDFTLAEIKTLRAKERTSFRDHSRDGFYEVPTFQELISLVKQKEQKKGRVIGIYPETKHPTHHKKVGLTLEEPLLAVLRQNGYEHADAPVFIQSFEIANLREMSEKTDIPLIQLLDEADMKPGDVLEAGGTLTYRDMTTPGELQKMAAYAYGVGPWKELIMARDDDGKLLPATAFIDNAHANGLKVHIYTMRNEPSYLAVDYDDDPKAEYRKWAAMGIDGFFTDFPDTAVEARREMR